MILDVTAFGYHMEVTDRSNTDSITKLAFLKDEALCNILTLHYAGKTSQLGKIRIKLEVDTNPPLGGINEIKYIDFPYLSSVTVQNMATLFAGKIHALLCRNYVKGRDWYDFLWYTSHRTPINYNYLQEALYQTGPWKSTKIQIDHSWLYNALYNKISNIDWLEAAKDVRRFIPPLEQVSINLWSKEVFLKQLDKL